MIVNGRCTLPVHNCGACRFWPEWRKAKGLPDRCPGRAREGAPPKVARKGCRNEL